MTDNGQFNHGFHRLWKVNKTYPMSSYFSLKQMAENLDSHFMVILEIMLNYKITSIF